MLLISFDLARILIALIRFWFIFSKCDVYIFHKCGERLSFDEQYLLYSFDKKYIFFKFLKVGEKLNIISNSLVVPQRSCSKKHFQEIKVYFQQLMKQDEANKENQNQQNKDLYPYMTMQGLFV